MTNDRLGENPSSLEEIRALFPDPERNKAVLSFLDLLEGRSDLLKVAEADLNRWMQVSRQGQSSNQLSITARAQLERKTGGNALLKEAEIQLEAALMVFSSFFAQLLDLPSDATESEARALLLTLSRQMGALISLVKFIEACHQVEKTSLDQSAVTFSLICDYVRRGALVLDAPGLAKGDNRVQTSYIQMFGEES